MNVQDANQIKGRRGYLFRLSRDHPKIWADRLDVVLALSVALAGSLGLLALALMGAAPSYIDRYSNSLEARSFGALFAGIGGIMCTAATAYWMNVRSRTLDIRDAPSLSRTNPVIRLAICLMALWCPFIFIYAILGQEIHQLHQSMDRNSLFDLRFFYDPDPWLSIFAVGIMSLILGLAMTLRGYGTNIALAGLLFSLVWMLILFFLMLFLASVFDWNSDEEAAYLMGTTLASLMVLPFMFRGESGVLRVAVQAPGIYAAGAGPWILAIGILFSRYEFSSAFGVQLFMIATFIASALYLALLWRCLKL